ncbi:hypothetical protein P9Z56_29175 [Bacillus cereus]|nr:hypothetical protein [Bacillus cereus]MEC2830220.1 hypothetical protein [Bacillus cereus]
MKHESNKVNELIITDSNLTFKEIYAKSYFPKELEEDVKKANFLLIPYDGFKSLNAPVFPEDTMKFYQFIKESSNHEFIGEICIADEEYAELELHSDLITLAAMLLDKAVLPIAIGLITNYIDRKVQQRKTDVKVKVNMTVVDGDKSTSISYEGDADKFEETIKAAKEFNN